MAQGTNKAKARQSSRSKGYYEAQKYRTTDNKARRAKKRTRRKNFWLSRVFKKNGRPVSVKKKAVQ